MNKTAIILSKEEALALPPAERPLSYRLPSKMYHDVWEAVGRATVLGSKHPRTGTEAQAADEAGRVALNLCLKLAEELERQGITYENMKR